MNIEIKDYHITKEGDKILFSELKDSHLRNIINFKLRQAERGVVRSMGSMTTGSDNMDIYYEEETYLGIEYLKLVGFKRYFNEALKRGVFNEEEIASIHAKIISFILD